MRRKIIAESPRRQGLRVFLGGRVIQSLELVQLFSIYYFPFFSFPFSEYYQPDLPKIPKGSQMKNEKWKMIYGK
jgi:hypothetical protein